MQQNVLLLFGWYFFHKNDVDIWKKLLLLTSMSSKEVTCLFKIFQDMIFSYLLLPMEYWHLVKAYTHLFCTFDSKFRNQGKFPTLEKSQVLGTWNFFQFCNHYWENGNPGAGSKYVYIFFRFADLYFYWPRKS